MSKDLGKKIKFLAIFIGIIGALACLIMAFSNLGNKNYSVLIAWVFLAVGCVLLILPLSAVGSMISDMAEQREKMQILSDKMAKMSRQGGETPADKFSPSGRIKIQKFPQTTMRQTAPSINQIKPANTAPSSPADDFTRSLDAKTIQDVPPKTEQAEQHRQTPAQPQSDGAPQQAQTPNRTYDGFPQGNQSRSDTAESLDVEPSATLKDAFRQSSSNQFSSTFLNTTGLDTFAINRRVGAVIKALRNTTSTISAGGLHSAAVFSSGRCSAVGYGTYGQCNISNWGNIISVSAGNHHTVGLKSNGTCVATGYNGYGQCNVADWAGICQIATGVGHTVGLYENGTCVATGDNTYGQCNVFDWTDIVSIVAGYNYTVGLKVDGTIVAVGANTDGQWSAVKWGSISAIAAGGFHTVGLKNDGTCVAVGNDANDQCDVSRWTSIRAVAAGNYHTVGLRSDGTCVATGYNGYGQCDVFEWRNIVAISAGRNHTLGLTANGKVIAAGDNTHGQCNVADWSGVKIPKN